jgi:hypothetical protein
VRSLGLGVRGSLLTWRRVGCRVACEWRGLACAIAFRDANPAVSPSSMPVSMPPGRISSGKSRCLTRPHTAVRHNHHRAAAREAASFNPSLDRALATPHASHHPAGFAPFLYPTHAPFS